MFPRLQERQHTQAGVLSGGEQQMLTLCRTLMGDPELIMIDEPTEGTGAEDRRSGGRVFERVKEPWNLGFAGGAEARDRAGDFATRVRDGTWGDRLRRHAGSVACRRRHPTGMVGGLTPDCFSSRRLVKFLLPGRMLPAEPLSSLPRTEMVVGVNRLERVGP